MRAIIEKVNGKGWLVTLIWNTILMAALYWFGLRLDILRLQEQQSAGNANTARVERRVDKLDDKVDNLTWAIATNRKPERPR